ncbi:MAG: oligosaccharide flippase family protein [Bacillota bacterium]|nr:oligosaccharide flippase family protein [Bacillota bacterium]
MSRLRALINNRIVRNFIVLFTGEGVVSIIGMINLAIIVNTIGNEKNGIIIMVQTYSLLFSGIFGFKSFQALIKYMPVSIEEGNEELTKQYVKQSFVLDIGAAAVATVFGYICLDFVCNLMGWDSSMKPYIKMFLITLIINIQGTPIGVLRIFNKFNYITYSNVVSNLLKLTLYVLAFITHQGFQFFFIVEIIFTVMFNIILIVFTFITLKQQGLGGFYKGPLKLDRDFFMFNFYSNITSTIDIPVGSITTMVINRYLGFTEISIYKIFDKIGSVIGKLSSPLNQIIYPEMSIMIAKKKFLKAKKMSDKLLMGISLIGAAFIFFILITHKWWLGIFIKDYDVYLWSLVIYLVYMIFSNGSQGVHSLFMALGYIKLTVPIIICVNSAYLVLLYFSIKAWHLNGVLISLILQAVAVVVIKIIIMKKNHYMEKVQK